MFKKNCKIIHDGKLYQCICKDREVAVFAPAQVFKDHSKVKYNSMFVVDANIKKATENGFKFKFTE